MNAVTYMITKEQCEARITGVCPGCGGPVTAIETVDNAGQPTHWSGCEACAEFTEGVAEEIHRMARILVEEGTLVPYSHIDREPRGLWLTANTKAVARILVQIRALSRPYREQALASARAEGVRAGRQIASDAILAHADRHAPKDGNEAQRRLRRHLHIAARVALPAVTAEEAAAALAAFWSPAKPGDTPGAIEPGEDVQIQPIVLDTPGTPDLMAALRTSLERAKADRLASLTPTTEEDKSDG